jgi:NitT/TauT family transport system substrate-binding protein
MAVLVGLVGSGCAPATPPALPSKAESRSVPTMTAPPAATGPVATAPAAPPAEKLALRFGGAVTPPSLVHLPPYVAKAMGFFDEVGLDVTMVSFDGGLGALRAANAGVDVAASSSDPLFAAVQNGVPMQAIGSYAARLSVVMMAAPQVATPRQLKGHKIGIQEMGALNHVMSLLVLQEAGLSSSDVQWVNISTANRVGSIVQGQTDAAVLHIDQYHAALAAHPELAVMARLWEVAPDWWYAAFVASQDTIRTKREALVRFMTAVIKAQRFMYANPEQTKRIAVQETKIPAAAVDAAYDDLVRGGVWSVNDGLPRQALENTLRKEAELGVVNPGNLPTYEQLVDRSIADEAVQRNGGPWDDDPRWL